MTDPLAQASDVAELWRPLTDAEASQADALCVRASKLLRNRMRNLDARIALPVDDPLSLDPAIVATTVAGIVKRVLTNPDGVWSRSRAGGPYSESSTYMGRSAQTGSSAAVLGELVVLDSDVDALTPNPARGMPATIRLRTGIGVHSPGVDAANGYPTGLAPIDYPNYDDVAP